jgi:hypothetical protein
MGWVSVKINKIIDFIEFRKDVIKKKIRSPKNKIMGGGIVGGLWSSYRSFALIH